MTTKERMEKIKAEIFGDMTSIGMIDFEQMEMGHILRTIESQKQFVHDGTFHYGLWRRWHRATTKEQVDAIMEEFREKTKAQKDPIPAPDAHGKTPMAESVRADRVYQEPGTS